METQQVIEGIIEEIIYRNENNGYCVCEISMEEEDITCVGTMLGVSEGEQIRAVGEYVSHHTYGRQFQIESYQSFIPQDRHSVLRYLSSGAIKGIGPALAKRIVKKFGDDSFRIIEEEPETLALVKGISEKKANEVANIFYEQREMRKTIIFLQEYGISLTYAIKIYNRYKERTMDIVGNNPYKLAEDIIGIGFKTADEIAMKMGIDKDSVHRVKAGIMFILRRASLNGHTYLPKNDLIDKAEEMLLVPYELIENAIIELQINKQIISKEVEDRVITYNMMFYHLELNVARKIYDLAQYDYDLPSNVDNEIKAIEESSDIVFDDYQRQAIKEGIKNGVIVVTGGPGTGKTTTINSIIELLEIQGLDVMLAAPTGRAAKRMTEATGRQAQTIHRLLEISFMNSEDNNKFEKHEDNPLECDALIIDEASMVDIVLMNSLLKALIPGTRLIIVGDKDQLPSVGPGNVLKDIIESKKIKAVKLEKIFRQARESAIIMNAHKINSGEHIDLCNKKSDFFYIKRATSGSILEEIKTLTKTRLPKFANCSPFDGIQILSPMRKGLLGTINLNKELQATLNPPKKDKNEKVFRDVLFREGDKVMQIKNNYNLAWQIKNEYNFTIDEGVGVFNGDIGTIIEINQYTNKLKVKFEDDKVVEYEYANLEELELAYAVTIHKSQGSEYPVVVIPLLTGPSMLLIRNLLYTAVTRAKKYVVIVGLDSTIYQMIDNDKEIERYSTLRLRIQEIFDTMNEVGI
ncbi:SF1B family DNA helicase RecD2 [Vallitalea sp.]|jgi:exodeoxyribonuclease V alpha subunit|uniref:SF1B family DNA helicase RecD2 n=1 Tax=Vallitalea sp. TaxID=1882829 RepID=UPI0025D9AD3D|nr:ATP-dependent RecD-like DNA helicase [Vallitalea sp.]MCT4687976.1 ATP-dependent RecD-like DNA helicase [Vallitalea sp.]